MVKHPFFGSKTWWWSTRPVAGQPTPSATSASTCSLARPLAVVGESGSGKSTIAKTLVGMIEATAGPVNFEDRDLRSLGERQLGALRPFIQMIFQDPVASLNPRRLIEDLIAEGLDIWPDLVENDSESEIDSLMREVAPWQRSCVPRRSPLSVRRGGHYTACHYAGSSTTSSHEERRSTT